VKADIEVAADQIGRDLFVQCCELGNPRENRVGRGG
jgi:hypothetical protein